MKINIKNILIIGITGILLVMWIISGQKKEIGETGFGPTPTLYQKSDISVKEKVDYPEKVDWGLDNFVAEETLNSYSTETKPVSREEVEKFLSLFGLSYENKSKEEGTILFFSKDENSAYVNINEGVFGYTKTISNRNDLKYAVNKTVDVLKNEVENKLKIFSPTGLELKLENFSFKKFVYPYWQSSSEVEAEVVEFEGGFVINNKIIEGENGSLVKVVVRKDGEIIKVEMSRFFDSYKITGSEEIKNWEEVKNSQPRDFKITKVWGNTVYELNPDEIIKGVIIKKMKMIYLAKDGQLIPYFMFEADSRLNSGPTKVNLLLKAIKN